MVVSICVDVARVKGARTNAARRTSNSTKAEDKQYETGQDPRQARARQTRRSPRRGSRPARAFTAAGMPSLADRTCRTHRGDVPAGSEVRERRQPDRSGPLAADLRGA